MLLHRDADVFDLNHVKTTNPNAPLMKRHSCPKCGSFRMILVDEGWGDRYHFCKDCQWRIFRGYYTYSYPNPYLVETKQIFLKLERK